MEFDFDGMKACGKGTYLVNGRIVRIMKNSIDMSSQEGREKAVRMAAGMGSGPRGLPYGPVTVLYVWPEVDGPIGRKFVGELHRPTDLSDDVREALRKEMPEHADKI